MLSPQSVISDSERETGLHRLVREAALSSMTAALTTGVILTAFALHLGASNFTIGVLAALPFLAQLAQVPTIALIEHLRQRKRIAVVSSVIGRAALLIMAALPFLPSIAIPALVGATALLCVMNAVGSCAWNAWMRDLAPEHRMGAIFARRTVYSTVVAVIAGIAAAAVLEFAPERSLFRDASFGALYVVGCAAGLASAWAVARIPEPMIAPIGTERISFVALLRKPLKDRNFSHLLVFLGSWQFAINLATPFFTVFLVEQLGYSMTVVMGLSVASQLANVVALRNWGALVDRFSNKSVLLVAAPSYVFSIVGMIGASQITSAEGRLVWLILLHIFMGGAVAGVTLATANIALKLSPRGEAAAFLATSGVVNALAAGSAPILGGMFADFFANRRFEILLRWTTPDGVLALLPIRLAYWDFYFFAASIVGLYALHRLTFVHEEGDITRREMVNQVLFMTRSTIHNFSTVSGMRALSEAPAALLREAQVHARYVKIRLAGERRRNKAA